MEYERVTVFGAGNAGFAAAAMLSLMGRRVTLCDFPEFEAALRPAREAGEIDLVRQDGPWQGRARLHAVTTSLAEALAGAEAVFVCVQAHAHGRLGREAAPHLRDGQHVLILPGSCFGAWEFRYGMQSAGGTARVVLAESNTFLCAARRTEVPNQARIKHWATEVFVAALPAADTPRALAPLGKLFPQCVAASDTLETCLLNLNPYVHSAPAVLSISAVERSGGNFHHYVDAITPSTARAMRVLDDERRAVCRRLGYDDRSVAEIFYRAGYMGQLTGDWVSDMQSKPVLREAKGPFDVRYRYYTEDTGVGLTAVHSVGRRLGLPMPTHQALIHLCGVMNEVDYFANCTRTLEALGIDGTTADELRKRLAD
jgi:opine dehydrogenase